VTDYTSEFFRAKTEGSLRSARTVVPIVMELLKPGSVVDVGCGRGTWLSVFAEHGIADVVGVDGDYVDRRTLLIPPDRFVAHDLTTPLRLHRTFDLVVSLEVAEHLPVACAGEFVASLTSLGSAVLFSAAVPGQGGTHHVNERWQDYWGHSSLSEATALSIVSGGRSGRGTTWSRGMRRTRCSTSRPSGCAPSPPCSACVGPASTSWRSCTRPSTSGPAAKRCRLGA
jgi:SAM-dependent methyltransferase